MLEGRNHRTKATLKVVEPEIEKLEDQSIVARRKVNGLKDEISKLESD